MAMIVLVWAVIGVVDVTVMPGAHVVPQLVCEGKIRCRTTAACDRKTGGFERRAHRSLDEGDPATSARDPKIHEIGIDPVANSMHAIHKTIDLIPQPVSIRLYVPRV